ncbi:hypothetical protein CZ774_09455 [Frigoribacterium sp. JB110]|nr:hypothetical protein CZ774_09455 [Frigoribacterium sp. JB110]
MGARGRSDDTARWYSDVDKRYEKAEFFARCFQVPGRGTWKVVPQPTSSTVSARS